MNSGEEFQRRGRMISGKQRRGNREGIRGFIAMVSGQLGMALMASNRGRNPRPFPEEDELMT